MALPPIAKGQGGSASITQATYYMTEIFTRSENATDHQSTIKTCREVFRHCGGPGRQKPRATKGLHAYFAVCIKIVLMDIPSCTLGQKITKNPSRPRGKKKNLSVPISCCRITISLYNVLLKAP